MESKGNNGNRPIQHVDTGPDTAPNRDRRIPAYLVLVVLVPALFLLSAIPIVRSPSFLGHASDPFLMTADYAFTLNRKDCQILVYGDSTALTGIDPTVVGRLTGLKTCNIAQSQSIFELLGPEALDTYLRNNAPPRFIVMQFAPETLARGRTDFFWPEGLTLLLRRHSLLRALPILLQHPIQAYGFSIWAIKTEVNSFIHRPSDFGQMESIFEARDGLLVLPKPAQTSCTNQTKYMGPTTAWVAEMRHRYSNDHTRVLVDLSPLPTCTPDLPAIHSDYRGVTDNTPPIYPIGLFCDIDRHLTLDGSERASSEIAEQILHQAAQ